MLGSMMKNKVIEIPVTDVERVFNRKPNTWQEWLDCMGLKKEIFTIEQLEAIERGCKAANRSHNNGKSRK